MVGIAFWFAAQIAAGALIWTVWTRRHRIIAALRGRENS